MSFLAGKRFLITGVLSQPFDRLRHRPRLPRPGRRAGLQLRRRTLPRTHRRVRRRVRLRAGLRVRRGRRRPDRARCSSSSAQPGPAVRRLRPRHRLRAARGDLPATFSRACRARASASRTTSRAYSFPAMAKAALPYLRPSSALLTLSYLGARCARPQLQHDGPGQGLAGGQRALPGGQPGAQGRARQRHLGRADQDAGRLGHQGLRQAAGRWWRRVRRCAATSRSTTSATSPPSCSRTWPPA